MSSNVQIHTFGYNATCVYLCTHMYLCIKHNSIKVDVYYAIISYRNMSAVNLNNKLL